MSRYHASQPQRQLTSVPRASVGTGYPISDDDNIYSTRLPNSTRSYQPQHALVKQSPKTIVKYEGVYTADELPFLKRRTTAQPPHTTATHQRQKRRFHWLTSVGVALALMSIGALVFPQLFQWWQITQDDQRYGRPRTAHYDAVVGHHDSSAHPSHFIAINYRSQVQIIELPGGDATHAKVYLGPTLIGERQELVPVTLTFSDVNADSKPDMVIHVGQSQFVFLNEKESFRPVQLGEHINAEKKP